jgi:FkbM family methyltransferase
MIKSLLRRLRSRQSSNTVSNSHVDTPILKALFDLYGVDFVIDVGANKGQSGLEYRQFGFEGPILSLEPIEYLFKELQSNAGGDPKWKTRQIAAGSKRGSATINVSGGHAGASSLRTMTDNVLRNAPDQAVVRQEEIQVDTLHNILTDVYPTGSRAFAKIDVQGFENEVLSGLAGSEQKLAGIQIEGSLISNYDGETLLIEMIPRIYAMGFALVKIEEAWGNPKTREIYQLNAVFFRTDRLQQHS